MIGGGWIPTRVEVAAKSGDMAYASGTYTFGLQGCYSGKITVKDGGKYLEVWGKAAQTELGRSADARGIPIFLVPRLLTDRFTASHAPLVRKRPIVAP